MKDTRIKKSSKVWVSFGEDKPKQKGVVIDICPASRWSSPLYLVMFKSDNNAHAPLTTWYDAYRVFSY